MKKPIYLTIANYIEKKIFNNDYPKNERLPSERNLAEEYGVTRMTIRNSIEYLVSKGLLEKRLGSGNYVKRTSLNLNLNEQLSFSEKSHFSDKTSRTEVIEFEKIYNSKISKIFNLDKDKEFSKIKRLRYLDEEVVNIEITYLLCEMFPDISIEIMEKSKYDYVENFITIKESFNKIIPIIPDMDTQKIFHIDSNTPIFYKTSLGLTTKNIIFEYSELYFNPKIYEFSFISKR